MTITNKRVLVLAPHTDDGELGCGGTLHRLSATNEIYYAAFSSCEQSVPAGFERTILQKEVKEATQILGIDSKHLFLFDYEVRTFGDKRQAILDDIISLRNQIAPDLVLSPSKNDVHQDHQTIFQEAQRAFKHTSQLCYEMPWNQASSHGNCFVVLDENNLVAKLKAVEAYQSQGQRLYTSADFLQSLAKVRGVQAGVKYAEAFEVMRWVL